MDEKVTGKETAGNSREKFVRMEENTLSGPSSGGQARTSLGALGQVKRKLLPRDVAVADREDFKTKTRKKFNDVFQVKSECKGWEEYDIEKISNDISLVGRLSKPEHVDFFRRIGASEFVLGILEYGHKPVLMGDILGFEKSNNRSFEQLKDFGVREIEKLISEGKLEEIGYKPKVVNPLSVVIEPTKKRLVLDCSYLNKFIVVPSFKMEDQKVAESLLIKGGWMYTYDMKDGYHHISIHPSFRDYLGLKYEKRGKTVYARFAVAPFGERDIPYVFTKVMKPLVAHWRREGMRCALFLDDSFGCAATYEEALKESEHVRQDLMRAGVVWSIKKSCWNPVQKVEWLGYEWNSLDGRVRVKERRVEKLKQTCKELGSLGQCSARRLAGYVGQLISMMSVLGDLVRLMSKDAQIRIAQAETWDERVNISRSIKEEMYFWENQIDYYNTKDCFPEQEPMIVDTIEGDASGTGCGSLLNGTRIAAVGFTGAERLASSTWRELSNILFSLRSFVGEIKGRTVHFKSDCQPAVRICKVGSMKPLLQEMAKEIFMLCFNNKVNLEVSWIPRSLNERADAVSRLADSVDVDDWGLTQGFFSLINNRWGPLTIDLFANFYNAKCDRFYTMFYSPDSLGVDAFKFSWAGENALMVPPVTKIGMVLRHAELCRCKGVLVVPLWTSAVFWPMLKGEYAEFVRDFIVVKGKNVLQQGRNVNSIFGSSRFQGKVLAAKIQF